MKRQYHIVHRADDKSASIIQQFCQSNGQILLPIVNLIESASQVVETVLHEIQVHCKRAVKERRKQKEKNLGNRTGS